MQSKVAHSGVTRGMIREKMKNKGLTAAKIADIIGRPKKTVMGWVRHEGNDDSHILPMTRDEFEKI